MADTIAEFEKFTRYVEASALTSVDKASVINTISGYYHYGHRTFAYSAAATVPATAPDCKLTYARTFDHADWRDGEDLVQAGGVQGFNVRFNALKADLDAIRTDLDHAFQCQGELRQTVAAALSEIRDQLNAINRDIADCCNKKIDTIKIPEEPSYRRPDWPFYMPGFKPPVGPIDPIDPMPGLLDKLGDKVWINANDPNEAIIRGIKGTRVDSAKINGKDMDVWQTGFGLMMSETRAGRTVKPSFTPDALKDTTAFSRFLEENRDTITTTLPSSFDKKAFLDKFGAETLDNGATVASVLGSDQPDTQFASIGALRNAAIDHHVETLDAAGLADAAIVGAVGVQLGVSTPDIPVTALKDTDETTIKALNDAGYTTLGKLAAADTTKIATALGGQAGSAGELSSLSRVLVRLGRPR